MPAARSCSRPRSIFTSRRSADATPAVIDGFSDLILEVFGPQRGQHARSAIGVAELPFDISVEIEGEVEID